MNKYEELKNNITERLEIFEQAGIHAKATKLSTQSLYKIVEALDKAQKYDDIMTAKKPIITTRTTGYEYHKCSKCGNEDMRKSSADYPELQCPKCNAILAYNFTDHCPKCGQKILTMKRNYEQRNLIFFNDSEGDAKDLNKE